MLRQTKVTTTTIKVRVSVTISKAYHHTIEEICLLKLPQGIYPLASAQADFSLIATYTLVLYFRDNLAWGRG